MVIHRNEYRHDDYRRDGDRLGIAVANLLTAALTGNTYAPPVHAEYRHRDRCFPVVTKTYLHGRRVVAKETACRDRFGQAHVVPGSRILVERY